jgi:NAD(P)-dependent dehydrogenase (short-subunit alcohol dehydrogenase family)
VRLRDKVALITGSTSGIGKASALLFSQEGAKVVIAGRRLDEGLKTVDEINTAGGEAIFVQTDVSRVEHVKQLIGKAAETYGRIDILFNNAGIHPESARKPLAECSEEDWDYVMAVNVKGMFLTCKYVIPLMIRNGGGTIINTSSQRAFAVSKNLGIYSSSKGAIISFTKALAVDYAEYGIRANSICPGMVETEMTIPLLREAQRDARAWNDMMNKYPLKRFGKPEDVARAALFLASSESSWITGISLMVDGGFTII